MPTPGIIKDIVLVAIILAAEAMANEPPLVAYQHTAGLKIAPRGSSAEDVRS